MLRIKYYFKNNIDNIIMIKGKLCVQFKVNYMKKIETKMDSNFTKSLFQFYGKAHQTNRTYVQMFCMQERVTYLLHFFVYNFLKLYVLRLFYISNKCFPFFMNEKNILQFWSRERGREGERGRDGERERERERKREIGERSVCVCVFMVETKCGKTI